MLAPRPPRVSALRFVAASLGLWAGFTVLALPVRAAAVTQPPTLVALEQEMSELKITSLRFSLLTSVTVPPHDHGLAQLLKLLGLNDRSSGVVTTAPPAANLSIEFFGVPLSIRVVGNTTYVYFHKLARLDHGRPWIKLGRGGLSELITVNGHPVSSKSGEPQPSEPKLAEPPFGSLAKLLSEAHEVRELAPATLAGQPVTRFLAVLEPAQLKSTPLASASRTTLPPVPPPTITLQVAFAANGLPVQTQITEVSAGLTTSATVEIPAVNFPLVIEAPPASQTISDAQLKKLEKKTKK